jgi:hypothetical protein
MERITYRITLDAFRTGVQKTLQGFETADNLSRRIIVSLSEGTGMYEIPSDNVVAMIYVRTPNSTEPSINDCTIEDNTIIYDMLPITEEGITEMQIKLIETSAQGAKKVLATPRFALEVTEGIADDDDAEQSTTFTALETAVALAKGAYDERLVRVEVDKDCTFRAFYADGSVYENENLKDALYNGNAVLSESFAKGGTGTREGEDADNAMYYKDLSLSVLETCRDVNEDCRGILTEVAEKSVYTTFGVNFETGHLTYLSQNYAFNVNEETGNLEFVGVGEWTPPDATQEALANLVTELTSTITALENRVKALEG